MAILHRRLLATIAFHVWLWLSSAVASICLGLLVLIVAVAHWLRLPPDVQIAYVSNHDGVDWDIHIMEMGRGIDLTMTRSRTRDHSPTWSPDGKYIAFVSERDRNPEIYLMPTQGGSARRLTFNNTPDWQPTWLPDSQHIIYRSSTSPDEIHMVDVHGGRPRRLINQGVWGLYALSPDGERIAFLAYRDQHWGIYLVNIDGSDLHALTSSRVSANDLAWSPDGSRIAYASLTPQGYRNIFIVDVKSAAVSNITNAVADERQPSWSPDGQSLAYYSSSDGDYEVYMIDVHPTAGGGVEGRNLRQLTDNNEADWQPVWSPDGAWIAFLSELEGHSDVYLVDANCAALPGGCRANQFRLTRNLTDDFAPTWRPES